MLINNVAEYAIRILNIKSDAYMIDDMIDELEKINDLLGFKEHLKAQFSKEKYKHYTGYQKFLILVKDFNSDKFKLTAEQQYQVDNYAEKLFKKTCDCFDEVAWEIQTGNDIHSNKINLFIYRYFGDEKSVKDLKVLEQIGKREELVRLMRNKEILREKIKEVITSFTIKKYAPALENKSTIQKLKDMRDVKK